MSTFAYLPMVPIYYAVFSFLGDFRFANILADVFIMLSAYWIAKSFNRGTAVYAALAFAVMPPSIWLTSVTGTNIMVGTAFLMLSLAALVQKKYWVAAAFLGLGVASNQLVVLMLPLFAYYYWSVHKLSRFSLSLLVSAAIILPFYLSSPSAFFYDVVQYQLIRQLQVDGPYSLFNVFNRFGIQLSLALRVVIFIVPFMFAMFWSRRHFTVLLASAGVLLFLAAFVLPIDGFWNYFLPSLAILCVFIPVGVDEVQQRAKKLRGYNNSSSIETCLNNESMNLQQKGSIIQACRRFKLAIENGNPPLIEENS